MQDFADGSRMLQLNLLGPPEVFVDGCPPAGELLAKDLALLYYLAATGQPHSRAALAVLLWGDLNDAAARGNLRKTLATLRQNFGPHIVTEREAVHLIPELTRCDVQAFTQHAQEGLSSGSVPELEGAVALYRGDFLTAFAVHNAPDYDLWLAHTQERLRGLAVQLLDRLAQAHRQQRAAEAEIGSLRRILSLEPWREETHRQLMMTLADAGQRSAALRQYEACVSILAAELSVPPGAATTQLYQQIRDGQFTAAPAAAPVAALPPAAHPHLPAELSPIVGRERDLAELEALLAAPDLRLVSLVGPGGIGKTRLALALAHRLQPQFAAVAFTSVANVTSAGELPAVAKDAFGLTAPPGAPAAHALQQLPGRALLVLDNFEHLLPDGAAVVETLLSEQPNLCCMITTRQALATPWEARYAVEELAYPRAADSAHFSEYGAVQLFLQLARRTRARYALQRSELPHVVRICQLVGGMPLGIEFAAAQLGRLPCALIADELAAGLDRLDALQQETLHHLPPRQRSLLASFEASWCTLAPEEQRVLAVLSILRGEFTIAAAQFIAEATAVSILRLVDKSLLRLVRLDRYALHEVIRRLAEQKLAATPGAPAAAFARYRDYYIELAQGTRREIFLRLTNTPDLRGYFQSLRSHLHYIWQQTASQPHAVAVEIALNTAEMRLRTFEFGFDGDWPGLMGQARPVPAQTQGPMPLEELARQEVVPLDVIWLPEMVDEVADLTGAFVEEQAQMLPELVEHCSVDGRLIGVPNMLNIGVLYYRRDLLEMYGFGEPPRTWFDLEMMATEIQAQERAAGNIDFWGYLWQGYSAEHLTCNALEWQHAEGGGLILAAGGQVTVNNAQTIRALERARQWIGAISPPSIRMTDEVACEQAWLEGRAAFMRLWLGGHPIFEDPKIGDLTGVTVLPRGAAGHAGTLGFWPLTVRLNTPVLAGAVKLIKEICAPAVQRARALSMNPTPPTLRALYDDPAVLARFSLYREALALVEAGGLAIRPAKIAGARYSQVSTAYSTAVAGVLYDGKDAATALAELEQRLATLLASH